MKKILLSSLLAVMAVTSANAKIASTGYVDDVQEKVLDDARVMAQNATANANSYTNEKIGALNSTVVTTGTNDGHYATVVTQTDGKISTARVQFDGSIDDDSTALNAPTSLAVKTYVDRAITDVEGEIGGGYQKLDQKLTSTDPETKITPENSDLLYPSYAKADAMVGAGVQSANAYTDGRIQALDVIQNGDGDFVIGVTQRDGVVSVTKGDIDYSDLTGTPTVDTAMNAESTNAVQNKVIKSYVDSAITGVNGDVSGKVSINQGASNKDKGLIVNASGALELADVATDEELGAVSTVADQAKAGVVSIYDSDVMNSGITADRVIAYDGYATGKQDTLTTAQLAAVDSGITAPLVATYNAYDDRIEQNKDDIAAIAGADEATEGSEDGQYVLTKKVVNGATTYSWELIDRALAN